VSYFRLKCTKFDFGWNSATDPTGELTRRGKEEEEGRGEEGEKRRGGINVAAPSTHSCRRLCSCPSNTEKSLVMSMCADSGSGCVEPR